MSFITKSTDKEVVEESSVKDWSSASVRQLEQTKPSSWFWRMVQFLEVKQHHNGSTRKAEGIVESFLYNDDLAPVESRRRMWSWKQFVFFWISGAFNVNTWQISATGLQLGLNWWQTWICVWFGYSLVAVFLVLGSLVGSNYHISFPISCRIGFGTYFSIWIVFNRLVMACVWYSTIGWLGGQCVQLMLMSLFGTDLPARLGDHISNPHLNDFELLCFLLFWVASLPLLWFPPHSLRHVFKIKSAVTPFAAFGFLIWALVKSKGKVALGSLREDDHVYPSQFWAVVRTVLVSLGNFATLILNAPDFSRFARSRKSCVYSQLIALPVIFSLISLTGILVTASSYTIFHVNEWNPLITLGRFLNSYSATDRALVFLIATIFCFDQLGANLANNAIPAGTDMTALLPKFINIRRGSYICACISLIICPWNLMASSDKFTKALSSYATFISSISGVLAADYFIVRKGYVNLQHCYSNKVGTFYMYNKFGTNWRAVVAYVIGIAPNFPGFLGDLGVNVSSAAMKIFYFNYLVGYFLSAAVYVILVYYFPVEGMPDDCELLELNKWREEWQEVENFAEERIVFENCLKGGFTSSYNAKQEV